MSQKFCVCYTLGVRYLYFKRNVEKFGVRVIGQKIRYFDNIKMHGTNVKIDQKDIF